MKINIGVVGAKTWDRQLQFFTSKINIKDFHFEFSYCIVQKNNLNFTDKNKLYF